MSAWKCPACQTPIVHDGDVPDLNRVYRCHICRLELMADDATHRLIVAPLPGERRRASDQNA